MQTFMVSMNIVSNGRSAAPEALRELRQDISAMNLDGSRAELAYHRQLWRLSGFGTYQFTLIRRGSGPRGGDIRVRVKDGVLASALRLDERGLEAEPIPVSGPEVGTIDDYFQRIDQELCHAKLGVNVYYHPQYGYPMSFRTSERFPVQGERFLAQGEARQLA